MSSKLIYLLFYLIATYLLGLGPLANGQFIPKKWPIQEYSCMQYFDDTAKGYNAINAYLLSKLNELSYPERLDYNLRYIANGGRPVDSIPSTKWINENIRIDNSNFEPIFRQRFAHYFSADSTAVSFYFLDSTRVRHTHFLWKKRVDALDPEIVLISTASTIFILFRGTDNVQIKEKGSIKSYGWSEWTGTNFRLGKIRAKSLPRGTRVHKGYWKSFGLIQDKLIQLLERENALHKKIWLSGHSLGAAQSILAATYLASKGFPVEQVYAYASPLVLGNKRFKTISNKLLANRIQRIELGAAPVCIAKVPFSAYKVVGQRHWFDFKNKTETPLYKNCSERHLHPRSLRYYKLDSLTKKEALSLRKRGYKRTFMPKTSNLYFHNPPYYTEACYKLLSPEEQARMPLPESPYPYIYYGKKDSK